MKRRLMCLLVGSMHFLVQAQAVDLEASLTRAIANKVYRAPTPAGLSRARELFRRTLQGHWTNADLTGDWAALGFEFQEIVTPGDSLWLLSEPAGRESGGGWYLFRTKAASSIALEAPHARNDLRTGMIALEMFRDGRARVLAASTITRHQADMAHREDTYFHAFTLAFASACPTGLVIQVHGFEPDNHPTVNADIIASAGTRSPQPWLTHLVDALKQATALSILAYPRDTRQLGATQNAQGRALRQTAHCRFLHLEMSRKLRERLTHDDELRRAIVKCVSSVQSE